MEKIGLQLYSVKELCEKDFLGTIAEVAKIGYDGVEFAGYFGASAAKLKKALDDCGMKACGSHISIDALDKDLDGQIAYSLEIGSPYVICPYLGGNWVGSADAWKRTAEYFNVIGRKCVENGLLFGYHNHDFEFVKYDGRMAYDIMLDNADPNNLFIELDTFWVDYAGMDLAGFMENYGKRIKLLHIKDRTSLEDKRNTEIGKGIIDVPAIVTAGKKLGSHWYIVEQEYFAMDQLASVAQSLRYLRSIT